MIQKLWRKEMKDYDHQGRNGYVEFDGHRTIFSRDGFSFQLLYDKVGAEASQSTTRMKNLEEYILGKTQENYEIAILTGAFECFSYAPCTIRTSFYMIGCTNNIADTTIDKYFAIEFIGGSLDLLYKYRSSRIKKSEQEWLLTIDASSIESNFDYNGKKCKIIICYAPSNDSPTDFATHLRFEFETAQVICDLQTYIRWAYRLVSLLLNRQNVGFDNIITYSSIGQFGDGWYPTAKCYIRNSYKNGLTSHRDGIGFEQIGCRIGELMRIIANADSREEQFTLNFHPESDTETNFVSTDQLRNICSALEHEIEVCSDLNVPENERLKDLVSIVKKVVKEHRDGELPLLESTYDLIFSDLAHWGIPLRLKIISLCEKFDQILLNCRDVESSAYSDERIQEFVKYRNKISHGTYYPMTQNVAETAIAMEALVYICILHRIGISEKELLNLAKWVIGR